MPKKKGPPYLDDPGCRYIVIENPWPNGKFGGARDDAYYQEVGAWMRYALNKAAYPETIYSRNTRADLVVKFSQDVDIKPLLGAHYWPNFLKKSDAERELSQIFAFNYRKEGHPENHQWAIHEIDLDDPRRWAGRVPFKQPYFPPTFAEPHRLSCADLALPIPRPREEAADPEPQAEVHPLKPRIALPDSATQTGQSRAGSLYSFAYAMAPKVEEEPEPRRAAGQEHPARPDEPLLSSTRSPTAEPVAARQRKPPNTPAAESTPDTRQQTGVNLFDNSKFDPYEQDEAAASFLKAEPTESRLPQLGTAMKHEAAHPSIKADPWGPSDELKREFAELQEIQRLRTTKSEPSAELIREFQEYQQTRSATATKEERPMKGEPHKPSAELIAEFNDYQNLRIQEAAVSPHPQAAPSSAVLAFQQELQRKRTIKPEPLDRNLSHRRDDRGSSGRGTQQAYERRSMRPDTGMESWSFHRDRQPSSAPARAPSYTEPFGSDPHGSQRLQSEVRGVSFPRPSAASLAQSSESRTQDLRERMRRESERSNSAKRERDNDEVWDSKRRRT